MFINYHEIVNVKSFSIIIIVDKPICIVNFDKVWKINIDRYCIFGKENYLVFSYNNLKNVISNYYEPKRIV